MIKRTMILAAAALRDRGWPMTAHGDWYQGCRPVRGVFAWSQHCLSLDPADRSIARRHPSHAGAVVLQASSTW